MENKLVIILMIMVVALVAGAGYLSYKLHTAFDSANNYQPSQTVQKSDTVYIKIPVKIPVVKYRQLPARIDTLFRTVHDTVAVLVKADMDTFITVGGVDYGRLYVTYWNSPLSYFDMDFIPAPIPQKIITKTVNLPCNQKWYEKKEVWAGAAVLIGGIISETRKK